MNAVHIALQESRDNALADYEANPNERTRYALAVAERRLAFATRFTST